MLTTFKRQLFGSLGCLIIMLCVFSGSAAYAEPAPNGSPYLADDTPAPPDSGSASPASSNFKVTGFLSVIGGNIFNGSLGPNYFANGGAAKLNGVTCPCYIADYANAGVYGDSLSIKPETHGGIQAQYNFTPDFNFVGQVTWHTQEDTPFIQWAYFNYRLNENFELHVGRQRLPLYYYSQFQDVGFAYPWVSPPPELYGWEVTNYDGASVRYTNSFGDLNLTASVFNGIEKLGHSIYYESYPPPGDTDVEWSAIRGADAEINKGPLTVRLVYLKANTSIKYNNPAQQDQYSPMTTYGIAVNLDFDSWFILSEASKQTRDYTALDYNTSTPASTIGAGYRWGKWTPFINYAIFTQHWGGPNAPTVTGDYKRYSATLRYDLDSSSDIKVQLDRSYDPDQSVMGNASVIRIGYDRVF